MSQNTVHEVVVVFLDSDCLKDFGDIELDSLDLNDSVQTEIKLTDIEICSKNHIIDIKLQSLLSAVIM